MANHFPDVITQRVPEGFSEALDYAAGIRGVRRADFVRTALVGAVKAAGVNWPRRQSRLARLVGRSEPERISDG